MEKIIICGLPGVDTERVHDLLRAHDFNIAAEGKIIEHFSSEWVDCVDDFRKGSRGSLKIHLEGMMKLYDDHNIRVISDIPALVLLRELVAHCSGKNTSTLGICVLWVYDSLSKRERKTYLFRL